MSLVVSSFFSLSCTDSSGCSDIYLAALDLDLEVLDFSLRLMLGVGSLVATPALLVEY